MTKTHRSVFIKEVKDLFPELRKAINSQNGLLHCEMHEFHWHVQKLIKENKVAEVQKAFQLIDRHFKCGNSDLVNAIAVSFLEHLDLGLAKGEPSWAYEYLPLGLREPYEQIRKYHGI